LDRFDPRWFTSSGELTILDCSLGGRFGLVHWSCTILDSLWGAVLASATRSLVHWFTGSWLLAHWLLAHWFTGSLVHWFTGSLVHRKLIPLRAPLRGMYLFCRILLRERGTEHPFCVGLVRVKAHYARNRVPPTVLVSLI